MIPVIVWPDLRSDKTILRGEVMSIFDILKIPDINEGLRAFHSENDAVLLDVRTREEYNEGHIPESVNIPLSDIHSISLSLIHI